MVIKSKNIILIGFMGVGKTTIGKELADKLNRPFIDLDHEIEKKSGKRIVEIFSEEGESAFREKERTFFNEIMEKDGHVLSLGGGAFLQEEIYQKSISQGTSVFLHISFKRWLERLPLLKEDRPLLQHKSEEEIKALYDSRREAYQKAHYVVHTDALNPIQTAKNIIKTIQDA